MSYSQL